MFKNQPRERRSLALAPRPQEQRTGGAGGGQRIAKEIQTCLQVFLPSAYICPHKDRLHDSVESLALEYTMFARLKNLLINCNLPAISKACSNSI